MKFHAKGLKFQGITASYHLAGVPTSAAMIDFFGAQPKFFYSPQSARRTRRTDNRIRKATGFQHDFLFLRALRVLRGGILRFKCQI
jgi:hypothetical protein